MRRERGNGFLWLDVEQFGAMLSRYRGTLGALHIIGAFVLRILRPYAFALDDMMANVLEAVCGC